MTRITPADQRPVQRASVAHTQMPAIHPGVLPPQMQADAVHLSIKPLTIVSDAYPGDPHFPDFPVSLNDFPKSTLTLVQHARLFAEGDYDDVAAYAAQEGLKKDSFARAVRNSVVAREHLKNKRLQSPPAPRPIRYTPMQGHIDTFIDGGYSNIQQYAKANGLSVPSFRLALQKSLRGKIYIAKLKAEGRFLSGRPVDFARMGTMLWHVENLIAEKNLNFTTYAQVYGISMDSLRDCFYASEQGKRYMLDLKESNIAIKIFPTDREKAAQIQTALRKIAENPENGIAPVAAECNIPPSTLAYRIKRAEASTQ